MSYESGMSIVSSGIGWLPVVCLLVVGVSCVAVVVVTSSIIHKIADALVNTSGGRNRSTAGERHDADRLILQLFEKVMEPGPTTTHLHAQERVRQSATDADTEREALRSGRPTTEPEPPEYVSPEEAVT